MVDNSFQNLGSHINRINNTVKSRTSNYSFRKITAELNIRPKIEVTCFCKVMMTVQAI